MECVPVAGTGSRPDMLNGCDGDLLRESLLFVSAPVHGAAKLPTVRAAICDSNCDWQDASSLRDIVSVVLT